MGLCCTASRVRRGARGTQGFIPGFNGNDQTRHSMPLTKRLREPPGLSELDAFRILEARGVFSQHDYYSPQRAADGFYRQRLKQLRAEDNQRAFWTRSSRSRRTRPSTSRRRSSGSSSRTS